MKSAIATSLVVLISLASCLPVAALGIFVADPVAKAVPAVQAGAPISRIVPSTAIINRPSKRDASATVPEKQETPSSSAVPSKSQTGNSFDASRKAIPVTKVRESIPRSRGAKGVKATAVAKTVVAEKKSIPSTPELAPGRTPLPIGERLQDRKVWDMRLVSEEINITITDHVAKTSITEVFKNDSDHMVSGTYLFPLPKDAAFSSFTLYIDGQPVKGEVLEATEARRQYENIVRLMVDPALLEYCGNRAVRARIFPIPSHGSRKVVLQYTQLLNAESGLFKYEFPLKAKNDSSALDHLKLNLILASKKKIMTCWSPTHKVLTRRADPHHASVSFQLDKSIPDRNFSLLYSMSEKSLAADLTFHNQVGKDGYFLLALSPGLDSTEKIAKDILIIADISGSMKGQKMNQARAALKHLVKSTTETDRLNVITFNSNVSSFRPELVYPNGSTRADLLKYIDAIVPSGGTNIGKALSMAR
ncbi:MAG: VWA domain-containing protein, partial [Microbacteriaceae bacterium]|nr:VWA domain-containing protein [Microbacteriaceae bacterium]